MTWNLSNVISALAKFSLIPASNAAPMSMLASLIASRSPPCELQKIREFLHRSGVLALGYVDDLAAHHIDEQADIIVAAPRRCFIRRDLLQLGQVLFLSRLPY